MASKKTMYQEEKSRNISIKDLIVLVKKNFLKIIGAYFIYLIITSGIIYLGSYYDKPYYTSSYVINLNLLDSEQATLMLEDINAIKAGNNLQRLSDILQMDIENVKLIKSIENISDKGVSNTLKVRIKTYTPVIIPELSKQILNYLNKNEYVLQLVKQERDYLKTFIEDLNKEISKIENSKEPIKVIVQKQHFSEMETLNPSFSSIHVITLKERKMDVLKKIENLNGGFITKRPLIPDTPTRFNSLSYFIIMNVLFLIFLIVIGIYFKSEKN